ncbi:MAG: hypothetical protein H7Y32_10260, partial [Chloroflexales bacterium]|nr:hypothetical protein [Chloroflexales bacterium]
TLTIYSARPVRTTLTLDLISPTAGALRGRVSGRDLPPFPLKLGPQTLRVPLDLPAGETPVVLQPAAGELTILALDLAAPQP